MAEHSAIGWTDATVNFWWGCTKVGPGCDHCYAETLNNNPRFGGTKQWGPGAPRRKIKGAARLIRSLQRGHDRWYAANGRRRRVFMQSMSDLFDNEVDAAWRREAFEEAEWADNLDLQFVTKRISNVAKMVPVHWTAGQWPRHVGLMITVINQDEADRDIPRLLALKKRFNIPWVGLSVEPMLGRMDLSKWLEQIDWVIVGGESGSEARAMNPAWARDVRDQCAAAGVSFFFKQWGAHIPYDAVTGGVEGYRRIPNKEANHILDGHHHMEFPKQMRTAAWIS